jgi:hypothetical protein
MDPLDFVSSLSGEQIPALRNELFRRRAVLQDAIELLLREVERRRAYRHQAGHHNGALRGRAVRRVDGRGATP